MILTNNKIKRILNIDNLDELSEYEIVSKLIYKGVSEFSIMFKFPNYGPEEIEKIKHGYVLEILNNGEKVWIHSSKGAYYRESLVYAYNKGLREESVDKILNISAYNIELFNLLVEILTSKDYSLTERDTVILRKCLGYDDSYSLITQVYRAFRLNMTDDEIYGMLPPKISDSAYSIRENILDDKFISIIIDVYLEDHEIEKLSEEDNEIINIAVKLLKNKLYNISPKEEHIKALATLLFSIIENTKDIEVKNNRLDEYKIQKILSKKTTKN